MTSSCGTVRLYSKSKRNELITVLHVISWNCSNLNKNRQLFKSWKKWAATPHYISSRAYHDLKKHRTCCTCPHSPRWVVMHPEVPRLITSRLAYIISHQIHIHHNIKWQRSEPLHVEQRMAISTWLTSRKVVILFFACLGTIDVQIARFYTKHRLCFKYAHNSAVFYVIVSYQQSILHPLLRFV